MRSFGNSLSYTDEENLFIIDSTPREDVADNRFGLNSKKKLRADNHSFGNRTLASPGVTSGTRHQLSKRFTDVFVAPNPFLSVLDQ